MNLNIYKIINFFHDLIILSFLTFLSVAMIFGMASIIWLMFVVS